MPFPTTTQSDLQQLVGRALKQAAPPAGGTQPDAFTQLAELGLMSILIPAEDGGGGGTFTDMLAVLEACGQHRGSSTVLSSAVLAAGLLVMGAEPVQKAAYLPDLGAGTRRWTAAVEEDGTGLELDLTRTIAREAGGGWTISGAKYHVTDLDAADYVLVIARTETAREPAAGLTLFAVDTSAQGVTIRERRSVNGGSLSDLHLDEVQVNEDARIGQAGEAVDLVSRALLLTGVGLSAQTVGAAQKVLEMTVDYVRNRKQFGSALGDFQSIQMRCAEMDIAVNAARSLVYRAGTALEQAQPAGSRLASSAKAWTADMYLQVTSEAHQMLGAMGFSDEYGLHLYTRSAITTRALFGDPAFHRDMIAEELDRNSMKGT